MIAVLVGLSGGVVLAAVAGARRSASSIDRFERAAHEMDVFVSAPEEVDGALTAPLRELVEGPLVRDFRELRFVFGFPAAEAAPEAFLFAPVGPEPTEIAQGLLLDGRRPDPTDPHEIVAFETTAELLGIEVGETLDIATLTPDQVAAFEQGGDFPTSADGPAIGLHVVGIARNVTDLVVQVGTPNFTFLSPAFLPRYRDEVGVGATNFAVDLLGGPDDVPRFTAEIERAYAGSTVPSIQASRQQQALADSVAIIARALFIFAVVVALAGATWVTTALVRHQRSAAEGVAVMRALGMTNGEARALLAGAAAPALVVGTVLGCVTAVMLSSLFPVGLARRIDPDAGWHVDLTVLGGGVLALLLLPGVILWITSHRAVARSTGDQRPPAPSLLLERAARRLPPAAAIGMRFAFSAPGSGPARVRPALLGGVLAVVGIAGVGVVASGIDRLLSSPARWGATWDVSVAVDESEGGAFVEPEAVVDDPAVAAAAVGTFDDQVRVAGHPALAMVIAPVKGTIPHSVVTGREPRGADEVALGQDTLRAVDADVGDVVEVRSATEHQRLRVVGVVAFPSVGDPLPLANGAALAPSAAERLRIGDPARADAGFKRLLIRWAPGTDGTAALRRLGGDELEPGLPVVPSEVARLDEVRDFPGAIAATLVVLGTIAVSYTLATTVRRRRSDLAVLSALGLGRRQRRAIIATQATNLASASLLLGIPFGFLVGRLVWSATASSMGVATDASQPFRQTAIGAVVVLVVFNLIAAVPAWTAGRLRVVDILRTE